MKKLHPLCVSVLMSIMLIVAMVPSLTYANGNHETRVCEKAKPRYASCHAHLIVANGITPFISNHPVAYTPKDIRNAYAITGRSTTKQIIAIIDAYDNPTLQNDLDTYSNQFGLPKLPSCNNSVADASMPCLQKVNQTGKNTLAKSESGWATETALDVEATHAVCENCSIIVVEATSPSIKNLLAAEDTAIKLGATVISNSWGGPEIPEETKLDVHFDHPGVAIIASSGDSGYGVQYPAASPYVTAVGGTTLYIEGATYKNEDAWSGSGSGCSQYEPKPVWQLDTQCTGRTVADVSAVADPATGFAVYTQSGPSGKKGWFIAGGTSLAAPIIAGVYAIAGNLNKSQRANQIPYLKGSKANLHDVVGGSNGSCAIGYLCSAKTKYDGPTGLGTPKGVGAFKNTYQ